MSLQVTLKILRSRPHQEQRYDTFDVTVPDAANVLDAIEQAWAHHDRDLMFRHACHHASCGTCAVRINGREKLPCIAPVKDYDGGEIKIEPLRNFPIVGDLVVDVAPFFQNQEASDFIITRPTENELDGKAIAHTQGLDPESAPTVPFNRFENCVECGICLSACPTMSADYKFFGPAGLAAIKRQLDKTTDANEREKLLHLADDEHGVWRCHSAWECTEACPQSVFPAESIMALRKEINAQRFKKFFRL
ncbi:MAG: succinate dehydrogenase/fumarate reductase iron-sulfur subunit [Chloroflexota bacterium]|nr:MAG: succinate dehydrogenase/fumarate reductase iron-sulfur subunit [Chloroflexota bacterium]